MPYTIQYHPDVNRRDIPGIGKTMQKRIRTAIENRLLVAPERYSEPLRRTLKGYRKLRVGDYRVVLRIQGNEIMILGIRHRRDVYGKMGRRTDDVYP